MRKDKLNTAVDAAKTGERNVLQILYDALNQGQQKKIVKNDEVRELFDRCGVEYEE